MFSKYLYVDVDDKTRTSYIQRLGNEQLLDEALDKINAYIRLLAMSLASRDLCPVMPEPFIIGTK
jgi:hypothetical protein